MIIIWGSKEMRKVLAYTQMYTCPRCGNVNSFQVVRVARWFTLFWIPIFPYSFKYFMVCPVCQVAHPMEKEQAKALQQAANGQQQ